MKILKAFCFVLLCVSLGFAQSHPVTVTWTASTSPLVIGYNVYRAPCTGAVSGTTCPEGTFAKIGSPTGTAVTYTDNSVALGQAYSYYATSVCPATGACTGESVPSNHWATLVPGNPPAPPTGFGGTVVALHMDFVSPNTTVTAKWTEPPKTPVNYTLASADTELQAGSLKNNTGNYSMKWAGALPAGAGAPLSLALCDGGGCSTLTL